MNVTLRIFQILWFRFQENQSFIRASSLSFQSVFTIVPLLAVMFGIAKGFGLELVLQNVIQEEFRDQKEVINYFIQFGYRLLEQTRGGLVAGVGIILLLFTVMRLFANVEHTLNGMWGVKEGRSLVRKGADYLALILICPILIVASSSVTLFITTQLQQFSARENIGPILYLIPLLPYLMATALFTLIYIIMPNTIVRFRSGLVAGIFAGVAYQILQTTYISVQIQISNAGAIYGSFAALPLFLMWLYLSWVIFLIGGQIAVIYQDRLWDQKFVAQMHPLTPRERHIALLCCTKAAVDGYLNSAKVTLESLSALLALPEKEVGELLEKLENCNLLFKVATQEGNFAYLPAISPEKLRAIDVLIEADGTSALTSDIAKTFDTFLTTIQDELQKSPSNRLLKDIK